MIQRDDDATPLPKRPSDPFNMIALGIGLGILGGIVSITPAGPIGILIAGVGGLFGTIGVIGQGALMGLRMDRYERELLAIADQDEDD